jgi:diaminohydroxyphosphoribosylaminopyrimidine deaminase/5-amino-6-(5-phosphoribosylamino)uracil reductase
MTAEADRRFMALALSLGRRGLGRVWPNPAVGCVIVREGRVIGRGWTQDGGRPHAETVALEQAGEGARGATAYVTLEPCNHTGQTPPCSAALVRAGLARVVVATEDPDPRTAGAGIATLASGGDRGGDGVMEAEARRDHAGFLSRVTGGAAYSEPETGRHARRADRDGDRGKPLDHWAARAAAGCMGSGHPMTR